MSGMVSREEANLKSFNHRGGMSITPPAERQRSALRFQRNFLLLLVVGITIAFVLMVRGFIMAVLLAAVFAGLSYPLYAWLRRRFGGRAGLASIATILILLFGIGVPLSAFLALVATQAVQLSQDASAWIQDQVGRIGQLRELATRWPLIEGIFPDEERLREHAQNLASRAGPFFLGTVAAISRGTLSFVLQLFVCLYAMFFFFVDGPRILRTILFYVPLHPNEEEQLLERFVSVTRATLRGSLLIGVIQGSLAGLAFMVAGVPGAAFWGTIMVILSILPAVGSAIVWVPTVLYLFASGASGTAVGLLIWCVLVVGTVDNFLRPWLVGRDAKMSDLLILLSTLGGIGLFGALGFIAGPIVAALFVTVWHIYGEAFRGWLPVVPDDFFTRTASDDPRGRTSTLTDDE
jgi:predicted PurR-regulated permease PerM